MPGFELFDNEEKKQINDVIETGILFRYGFDNIRNNQWKARELEIELAKKLGVKIKLINKGKIKLNVNGGGICRFS